MIQDALRPVYYAISDMPSVRERALRSAIGSMYRQWCTANPCPEHPSRFDLYRSVLDSEHLGSAIDYLEFGVWEGESIRWWTENNREPTSSFHGFDSFEGLPVNWEGMPKGAFSTGGVTPDIPDPRCHFVKGYFHQTFPGWLAGRDLSRPTGRQPRCRPLRLDPPGPDPVDAAPEGRRRPLLRRIPQLHARVPGPPGRPDRPPHELPGTRPSVPLVATRPRRRLSFRRPSGPRDRPIADREPFDYHEFLRTPRVRGVGNLAQ